MKNSVARLIKHMSLPSKGEGCAAREWVRLRWAFKKGITQTEKWQSLAGSVSTANIVFAVAFAACASDVAALADTACGHCSCK